MYKVTKMKPSEISEHWESFIKQAVVASLPPTVAGNPEQPDFVLAALMQERMQGWVGYREEAGEKTPVGFMTTMFTGEIGIEVKNLLVYSLFATEHLTEAAVRAGFEVLQKFAKDNKCFKIIGYTNIPRVVEIVQALPSGKADFVLVSMEVDNEQ